MAKPSSRAVKPGKLQIKHADPRSLNPAAYNPRKITPRELAKLRTSIRSFGFVEPVVVRAATNDIIGGHQRVKAAIAEGLKRVPVVRLEITEQKAKALNLALNRIHGEWDVPKLRTLLDELAGDEFDLKLTGFEPAEIEQLANDSRAAIEEVDLRPPPSVVWILCGIPLDVYGEVREHVAALETHATISIQASRDKT
jgi:ParB-like chromosome segregation protein Spo0J